MFRFTIRDLLWLMVVVGLVCVWWAQAAKVNYMKRESEAQKRELESAESNFIESEDDKWALISELEKRTGKRYRGMTRWSDPTGYPSEGIEIFYDENKETSKTSTEAP